MQLKRVAFLVLFLFATTSVCAQFGSHYYYHHYVPYRNLSPKAKIARQRHFIALTMPVMALDVQQTYERPANGIQPVTDTAAHLHINSSGSYGFSVGTFLRLAKFKKEECLALELSMGFYYYHWSLPQVFSDAQADLFSNNAYMLQDEIPVCLMYKNGGEVGCNRMHKLLFSLGAGFAASTNIITYSYAAQFGFKLRPFVMSEVGYFAGIAWKVRAVYYPSGLQLLTSSDSYQSTGSSGYESTGVQVNSSGSFLLSLTLLPDSWRWSRDDDY